jgi:hypothetical protein
MVVTVARRVARPATAMAGYPVAAMQRPNDGHT